MATECRHRISLRARSGIWLGYWTLLFIATHVPVLPGAHMPRFTDKVIHFGLFFVLTLLGGYRHAVSPRPARSRLLLPWAALYAAYAGVDEWLQQFVGRDTDVYDLVANLVGVAVATALLAALWRPRATPDGSSP